MAHNINSPLAFGVYDASQSFRAIEQHSCVCFADDMGVVAVTGKAGDEESEKYAELFAKVPEMRSLLQDYISHFDNPNWSAGAVKEWVNSEWIPSVRELLDTLPNL